MAGSEGVRSVRFQLQPAQQYAVQLRLTPQLLEAVRAAQAAGEPVSLRFGATQDENAITVGSARFGFRSNPESTCDLLHVPPPSKPAAGAAVVAHVAQRLQIERVLQQERGRVRARAQEAERRLTERHAHVLEGKPGAGAGGRKGAAAAAPAVRRATPPPLASALVAKPAAVTAAKLAAGNHAAPRPPLPAAAATPPAPKSASKTTVVASQAPGVKPSRTVVAAARRGGLRLALIALLAERPLSMPGVKRALTEVAALAKSSGFRVPSGPELTRALKAVSEFKSPGKYVLLEWLAKELVAEGLVGADAGASGSAAERAAPAPRAGKRPREESASPGAREAAAEEAAEEEEEEDDVEDEEISEEEDARSHPAPAAAASPASAGPGTGGGSDGSGSRARFLSSSSPGSIEFDDAWLVETAARQPEPAPAINSVPEYEAAEALYRERHGLWFRLHQRVAANTRDVGALKAAIAAAPCEPDRRRLAAELERLYARRVDRLRRWKAAKDVLQAELVAAKAAMADFVRRSDQEALPPPQQAPALRPMTRARR